MIGYMLDNGNKVKNGKIKVKVGSEEKVMQRGSQAGCQGSHTLMPFFFLLGEEVNCLL